jgi:biotin carboxyl carrier protein
MWGPQDGAFTDRGRESFLAGTYTLSARSDRVGCRFEGPSVEHRAGADIVSDGTAFGAVQISGDGLPIVLMADRGTTGGYTKIATVISADLPILAQAAPGTSVRFRAVDRETAVAALLEREAWLAGLTPADSDAVDDIFDEDRGSELAADGAEMLAAALDVRRSGPADVEPGVRAGMTGVVAAVLVEAGATVVARDVLLVIEAMKMQNPVRAPRAGRVARVHVSPGMPVSAGTVVVDYED